jgi:hypothetical protein
MPIKNITNVIVCDLDGTLAINDHGRDWYDAHDCDKDAVNIPVLTVLRWAVNDFRGVIFVSGREERFRTPTRKFLNRYLLDDYPLFMRNDADNRSDVTIKREIYEEHIKDKYDILFVLDDRNSDKCPVVDMWREQGLTCFQVANGDF